MPENNTHTPDTTTPISFTEKHHAHLGPILGVLVIVLVLILGGLFLWGGFLAKTVPPGQPNPINNEPETLRAQTDTQILGTMSPSDDLAAIETDIGSTNLDSLDTDLTAVDNELNNSLPK